MFAVAATAFGANLLDDPLLGSTRGQLFGGRITASGFRPETVKGHVLYRLALCPKSGALEVEIYGMRPDTAGDHTSFALYYGRGVAEPARYFEDFRDFFFRLNVHWRTERQAIKAVVNCAAPEPARFTATRVVFLVGEKRDFVTEPTGRPFAWDPGRWHHLRLEWSPSHVAVRIDGEEVWHAATAYCYVPREPRLWLGCAPGHGTKYPNHVPEVAYRHLQIVATSP